MITASKILFHHSYGHVTIVLRLTWKNLKFLLKALGILSAWGCSTYEGKWENSGSGEYLIDSDCWTSVLNISVRPQLVFCCFKLITNSKTVRQQISHYLPHPWIHKWQNYWVSTKHICRTYVQDLRACSNRQGSLEQVERKEGFIFIPVRCLWHFCYIEENAMHCACLSSFSISCHVESWSGDSVIGNPAMHCNFDIKIHYILPSAQSKSSAHCTVFLCTHTEPIICLLFLCIFTFTFHMKKIQSQQKPSYTTTSVKSSRQDSSMLLSVNLLAPLHSHLKLWQVTYFQIFFLWIFVSKCFWVRPALLISQRI